MDRPTIEPNRLREIGWRDWDPIGLANTDCPRDEYDTYLLQVVSRLRRGQSIPEVVTYLEGISSEYMGLGPSTSASRAAAEKVATAIRDYLETLPPGALSVR